VGRGFDLPIWGFMQTIAVMNEKGGAGKTSLALSLSAVLGAAGRRVLLVDADPQGNAGLVLSGGDRSPPGPTLADVLLGRSAGEAVRPSLVPGVDWIPAGAALADAADRLAGELGRERRLRLAVAELPRDWELVLIDCPPTRSLLSVNAMNAADGGLIVPVDPGVFSVAGLVAVVGAVEQVRKYLDNHALAVRSIVLSRVPRNRVAADLEAELRAAWGDVVAVTTIPQAVAVEESHARFLPVTLHAPRSVVSKSFHSLAAELFPCQTSLAHVA
jgi:chromosome partitioning protein